MFNPNIYEIPGGKLPLIRCPICGGIECNSFVVESNGIDISCELCAKFQEQLYGFVVCESAGASRETDVKYFCRCENRHLIYALNVAYIRIAELEYELTTKLKKV